MSVGKRYVLDANVFIEAHQKYYGLDLCPGFWDALKRQNVAKRLFSIDKIRDELVDAGDELSAWAKTTAPAGFFKGTADKSVIASFSQMVKWVQNEKQFTPEAKAEFARVADGWVVAYAAANGLIVVTHEEYAPAAKNRVPIPNVCVEFSVVYCNTFEMFRNLKEKFVSRSRSR